MPCLSVGWMDPCCSHQGMHELPSFRNSIPEETDALTQMELLLTNPRLRSSPKNFKKNSRHGRNATHPKNRGRFRKWFAWNEGFPFRPPIRNLLIALLHLGESQPELWRDGERDLPNFAACSPTPHPHPSAECCPGLAQRPILLPAASLLPDSCFSGMPASLRALGSTFQVRLPDCAKV